jgi:hypothetical protein
MVTDLPDDTSPDDGRGFVPPHSYHIRGLRRGDCSCQSDSIRFEWFSLKRDRRSRLRVGVRPVMSRIGGILEYVQSQRSRRLNIDCRLIVDSGRAFNVNSGLPDLKARMRVGRPHPSRATACGPHRTGVPCLPTLRVVTKSNWPEACDLARRHAPEKVCVAASGHKCPMVERVYKPCKSAGAKITRFKMVAHGFDAVIYFTAAATPNRGAASANRACPVQGSAQARRPL